MRCITAPTKLRSQRNGTSALPQKLTSGPNEKLVQWATFKLMHRSKALRAHSLPRFASRPGFIGLKLSNDFPRAHAQLI